MANLAKAPQLTQRQLEELFAYRLSCIRSKMQVQGIALCVLSNPVSLRYAIDFDEYSLFQSHIPSSYLFLPVDGPLVMHGATCTNFPNVADYRRPDFVTPFDCGLDLESHCQQFVQALKAYLKENNLFESRCVVALERLSPIVTQTLSDEGFLVKDAEALVESARTIKCFQEIICIKHSVAVAQLALTKIREATVPGVTENQLWSRLHQINIAHGGQWIDGRMLSSGHRTNPWLQEASHKPVAMGELVALDTDMIGPMGYCADISRSWTCTPGSKGNQEQRSAYTHAYLEIHHNIDLIRPGVTFRELCLSAFKRRPEYKANRYPCFMHGVGLSDEYPKLYYDEDWARDGYDGVLEENMVLSIESFSGAQGATEGVKLEEMVRVTATGYERLSNFPFEQELL